MLDATQTKTDEVTYWPYGEVRTRTGTNGTPFLFLGTVGYHTDSTGRAYVRNRVLEPIKARWLTEDPLGLMVADLNDFLYALSNPTTFKDPSGLAPCGADPGQFTPPGRGAYLPDPWGGGRVKTQKDCRNHLERLYDICKCLCQLQGAHLGAAILANYKRCMSHAKTQAAKSVCESIYGSDSFWLQDLNKKCLTHCVANAPGGIKPDNPPPWKD